VAAELGPFIQEEDAVMPQRHVAGHQYVLPADQPDVRDCLMRGVERAGRYQHHVGTGEADDAVDARRFQGIREGHRRQDGGEPLRQNRLAYPRGAEQRALWSERLQRVQFYIHCPRSDDHGHGPGGQSQWPAVYP